MLRGPRTGMLLGALLLTLAVPAGCATGNHRLPAASPGVTNTSQNSLPVTTGDPTVLAILAAAAKTTANTFRRVDRRTPTATWAMDMLATTDVDPRGNRQTSAVAGDGDTIERVVLVGEAVYAKIGEDGTWMKFEVSRLRPDSVLRQGIIARQTVPELLGLVSATPVGDGRYNGSVDLRIAVKNPMTPSASLLRNVIRTMGDRASRVPITITIDSAGRLTRISMAFESSLLTERNTTAVDISYSNFGEPLDINPPPQSEVVAATDAMYRTY